MRLSFYYAGWLFPLLWFIDCFVASEEGYPKVEDGRTKSVWTVRGPRVWLAMFKTLWYAVNMITMAVGFPKIEKWHEAALSRAAKEEIMIEAPSKASVERTPIVPSAKGARIFSMNDADTTDSDTGPLDDIEITEF
jgi:hypothetical protein